MNETVEQDVDLSKYRLKTRHGIRIHYVCYASQKSKLP
jgi:hypothetical protein